MSDIECPQVREMTRGESDTMSVDFGENTAGQETGVLTDSVTISSCTASTFTKPSGAADFTLGTPAVISTTKYLLGRTVSSGEGVTCSVEIAADQAYGRYVVQFVATLSSGKIRKRRCVVNVVP